MNIADLYRDAIAAHRPLFSVELIPPRNGGDIRDLYRGVEALLDLDPAFFSVTHGSGGSLRGGTFAICHNLQREYGVTALAHLTCVDSSAQDIENDLMNLSFLGVDN